MHESQQYAAIKFSKVVYNMSIAQLSEYKERNIFSSGTHLLHIGMSQPEHIVIARSSISLAVQLRYLLLVVDNTGRWSPKFIRIF